MIDKLDQLHFRVVSGVQSHEQAIEIAKRSRGTPIIANRLLKRVRDFAQIKSNGEVSAEVARYALNRLEIDSLGLDANDKKLLNVMIKYYKGGPVGLDTISAVIGEETITMETYMNPI